MKIWYNIFNLLNLKGKINFELFGVLLLFSSELPK